MSETTLTINNQTAHPDLWGIALAQLREDIDYLKLGVRVRLELETVKSQEEILEASMDIANTASLTNGLIKSVQTALDVMNSTMLDLKESIREAKVMKQEALDLKMEVDSNISELNKKGISIAWKAGMGIATAISFIFGYFI